MKILLLILRKLIPQQFFLTCLAQVSRKQRAWMELLRDRPDLISESLTLILNGSFFPTESSPNNGNMLKSFPFINMVNVIVQTIIDQFQLFR